MPWPIGAGWPRRWRISTTTPTCSRSAVPTRLRTIRLRPSSYRKNRKIRAFLIGGTCSILLAPIVALPYALATLILGARTTRLPAHWWPLLPFAFAAHHATYYFGILWGWGRGRGKRAKGEG